MLRLLLLSGVIQVVPQVLDNLPSPLQVLFHRKAVQFAAGEDSHRTLLHEEVEGDPPECGLKLLERKQWFDLIFLKDPMNYM